MSLCMWRGSKHEIEDTMKVRMSIHTGKTLILNLRQTVACERLGAEIDCEGTP